MKRLLPLFLLLSACATTRAPSPPAVTDAEMRATIGMLASDAFEGRMAGTAGEGKAAAYIAQRFHEAGLVPASGGFLQAFKVDRKPTPIPGEEVKLPLAQRHFIDQMNKRPAYVQAVLENLINWKFASDNFDRGTAWTYPG